MSQPVEQWEAELESEIFAVRQWMVECEPEGLRYPVRARILGRLLDIAHAPAQPEVGEIIAERDREWCLALAEIGVAAHANSVRHGKINVARENQPGAEKLVEAAKEAVHALEAAGYAPVKLRAALAAYEKGNYE